jgi:hypothetical protein
MKILNSFILLLLIILTSDAYGQRYIQAPRNVIIPTTAQRGRMQFSRVQNIGGWVAPIPNYGTVPRDSVVTLPQNVMRPPSSVTIRPSITRGKEIIADVNKAWGPAYGTAVRRHLGDLRQAALAEREEAIIRQANPSGDSGLYRTPSQLVNTVQVRDMRNSVGGNCGGNCPNIQQRYVTIGASAGERLDGIAVWCSSGNCSNDNPKNSYYIRAASGIQMAHTTLMTAYRNSGYMTAWGIGVPSEGQQFYRLRLGTSLLQQSGLSQTGIDAGRRLLRAAETRYGAQEIILDRY